MGPFEAYAKTPTTPQSRAPLAPLQRARLVPVPLRGRTQAPHHALPSLPWLRPGLA